MLNGAPSGDELALFVEDDVDISSFAYRWLRHLHAAYFQRNDIAAYGLQDENAMISRGKRKHKELTVKNNRDPIFLYKIPGSWGLAPHPRRWYEFQNWYESVKRNTKFKPYLKEAVLHTNWYRSFVKSGTADTLSLIHI